jgi:hypothetical protein
MAEVMRAVGVLQSGNRAQARELLLDLWDRVEASSDPLQRCTVAHFLADTEDDPGRELAWDLRALEAATGGAREGDHDAITPNLAAFLPSLHLNAGDAYRRLGNTSQAQVHAEAGLRRAHVLADEGYGGTVKAALERLQSRLTG